MRRPTWRCWSIPLLAALAPGLPGVAAAQPPWPPLALTPIAQGLELPVHLTHAGDGSGRLFVVELTGRIRRVVDGQVDPMPFLDISDRTTCCGERGLLSVAFPPGYADKGYFYVDYTATEGSTLVSRISRFHLTGDPDVADPDSEEILLTIEQPFANHNGGQLAFGPDGFLYVSTGDGGSGGDPHGNGQNPGVLLGKILRLDVESGAFPYAIPADNPFVGMPGHREEIWALGLRNPWRMSFDRATGDLYLGDVGQNTWEEIDFQPAASGGGENYGWRLMEGNHCFEASSCDMTGLVLPVAEYDHGLGCSVTGGTVWRDAATPDLAGIYYYADFCSGRIWGSRRSGTAWQGRLLRHSPFNVSSFGEDEAGGVYVVDLGGTLHRLRHDVVPADFTADRIPELVIYRAGSWYFFP